MVPEEKWQPEDSRRLVSSYEERKDALREKGERKIVQEAGSEREHSSGPRSHGDFDSEYLGCAKAESKDSKLGLHRELYREGKRQKLSSLS